MKRYLPFVILILAAGCSHAGAQSEPERVKVDGGALRKELAAALVSHHEWGAASRLLLELAAQRPGDPELHTMLGNVYREQGLFEQAERAYAIAIRLDPKGAAAYAGRGILREARGERGEQAMTDFQMAIRLQPNEGAYHNNLGVALYARGRYQEAEAALQDGLQRDPFSRRMRNNLGCVYGKLRQFDRARREFEHGGNEDEARNNLGYVYEQEGDLRSACALYRAAVAGDSALEVAVENARRACPPEEKTP